MHPVVNERVRAFEAVDELLAPGLPENRVHLFLGRAQNDRERLVALMKKVLDAYDSARLEGGASS